MLCQVVHRSFKAYIKRDAMSLRMLDSSAKVCGGLASRVDDGNRRQELVEKVVFSGHIR